ncbi:MAG: O-antigen ligase domain-containing protein [Bacteroidetes bacterium]|jgi:hypothetical protein|nr:O-antigen ligase domain-containing protein [Bacteroidota bacterium]MBT6685479.1 O-antigen ligase domain-containing protein [Bacteroidota bacterium]MBT7143742.1 O-antigen ligase domain-containing protein [Bacteroidota bacterium]MBT7491459.1 O-antigen ligase domain-containing protein [Bacteroidota bacterium]
MGNAIGDTGAKRFFILVAIALLLSWPVIGHLIATKGIVIAGMLLFLPGIIAAVIFLFKNPKYSVIVVFVLSFTTIGLLRYLPGQLPLGLLVDAILAMGMMSLFFVGWKNLDWTPTKSFLMYVSLIWMGYIVMEIGNPEMKSPVAWFYAMRGMAFYQLLMVPLALMTFRRLKDLDTFLKIWFVFSILASLKGLQQEILGPDFAEQAWLDGGGHVTHILFGKLRVFSFYSDAGQFGASQAQTGLVAMIIALGPGTKKKRMLFAVASLLSFAGMMISGTRGAMGVPGIGMFAYFLLSKNFKVLAAGIIFAILAFSVIKFTMIGQGLPLVPRMRTALDPNDKSLLVRKANQAKLAVYLAKRPIGGGIGTAGAWGLRFSPNTFLAQTPTDSWFVKIWAETGVVGFLLHTFILFFILIKTGFILWYKVKDPEIKYIMMALSSGFLGIIVASYGNGILGQMPSLTILILTWVFLSVSDELEKEKWQNLPENDNLITIGNGVLLPKKAVNDEAKTNILLT